MSKRRHELSFDYVIVGGGIAGVSCAKELERVADEEATIAIVSATDVLKAVSCRALHLHAILHKNSNLYVTIRHFYIVIWLVTQIVHQVKNVVQLTQSLSDFDVYER